MKELVLLDLCAQAEAVRDGSVRAEALLEAHLERADRADDALGAFLHRSTEAARSAARAVDEARRSGRTLGPLAGVPIALKDALCTTDAPTTCASRMLEGYVAPYDATVVTRLREAGAVLVGKTNLDEFAMGSSTEHSAYRPTKNPWSHEHAPGGSSGGSAAAVAARFSSAALGSDTGGSVRQPAAFTGVYGLKPTYGRVSRYGLVAFASSLDQIGPFATSVRGAARLLSVLAGSDPHDATCADLPVPDFEAASSRPVAGLRVGVLTDWIEQVQDTSLRAGIEASLQTLRDAGAILETVAWTGAEHSIAAYYVIASAEASTNLSRYDGIRFGRPGRGATLRERIRDARVQGFGPEVKRRIVLGTFVLSSGYYDAYYGKALQVRRGIAAAADALFARYDALIGPVTPELPFRLGARNDDPLAMYRSDLFTLPASLAGIPAASVPLGLAPNGLPLAVQLMTRRWDEATLLALSATLERAFPMPAPGGVHA